MSNLHEAAIAYIRFVCDQMDISPTALAKLAGMSSSTLTRPLNDPNHKHSLSMSTVNKIEKYSGIKFAPFANSKTVTELFSGVLDYENYDPDIFDSAPAPHKDYTPVIGEAASGVWRQLDIVDAMSRGTLMLKLSDFPTEQCFAVIAGDNSMNKVIDEKSALMCLRAEFWRGSLPNHGTVVVERRSEDKKIIEISIRKIVEHGDNYQFIYASTDSRWTESLDFFNNIDDPHSRIIGIACTQCGRCSEHSEMHKCTISA